METTAAPAGKTLKAGAISYISGVVIAVASTAPGYSLAATLGFIVAIAGIGVQAPAVILVAFIPMACIAAAYNYMNRADPDCGTTFSWVTLSLGPRIGWFSGWAVLVADMPEFANVPKRMKCAFVPHWESAVAGLWPVVCATAGLHYIDPRGEAKDVIGQIAACELIVAESMHGAILADAFRVPWVAVSTSANINGFKWRDWAATVDVDPAAQQGDPADQQPDDLGGLECDVLMMRPRARRVSPCEHLLRASGQSGAYGDQLGHQRDDGDDECPPGGRGRGADGQAQHQDDRQHQLPFCG